MSGNPNHGSFDKLKNLLEKARKNDLRTTIHCAEIVNSEEITSILEFHPDRIGHACYLHPQYKGCKKNWSLFKELNILTGICPKMYIHLKNFNFFFSEICLTSNVVCGEIDIYENHHLQEWIKDKLPFSLNVSNHNIELSTFRPSNP